MKIAVCIKRVPDSETRFKLRPDGSSFDETGVKYDMSDFDLYAVEAALQLKEGAGGGEVVAFSLGPDAVQETIRKAMSMGVDRGVHLKTDSIPFDGFAIASALADGLSDGGFDLVLFGKMSVDSWSGVTGPMVAELLGLPCVTAVAKLDVANSKGTARRELEGAAETVSFPLPAVLTIDEGMNQPRYPSLKGIMAAKKKPLDVKPAALGEQRVTIRKVALPPERPAGRIIGEGAEAVPELVRLLQTEAKVI
ncbi:MAG: electron transfer flavoprotein subunit beta/FixA family protein [Gemmatimonadaceae bacterium]